MKLNITGKDYLLDLESKGKTEPMLFGVIGLASFPAYCQHILPKALPHSLQELCSDYNLPISGGSSWSC